MASGIYWSALADVVAAWVRWGGGREGGKVEGSLGPGGGGGGGGGGGAKGDGH